MSDICTAQWHDDHGKDHECYDDADHTGGHECGCGARVPRWLLDAATAHIARQHAARPITDWHGAAPNAHDGSKWEDTP